MGLLDRLLDGIADRVADRVSVEKELSEAETKGLPPIEQIPVTGNEEGRRSYPRLWMSGSKVDWRNDAGASRLDTNGVIALGIQHYQTNWPSARLCVGRMVNGDFQEIPGHPFTLSLENPNPFYGGEVIWDGTIVSLLVGGNAYWAVGVNPRSGSPAFVYLPHTNVTVVGGKEGKFVGGYEYRIPGSSKVVVIPPENMIHFRRGMALEDQKLGFVAIQALIREVAGDNLASAYSAGLLKNFGATALIMAAKEKMQSANPQEREQLSELFRMLFSVEGAGKLAILPFAAEEVSRGFSPEEMALKSLRDVPVSRLLAAMGLNAMALDLPSDNKTYANYGEAIEASWRQGINPTQDRVAITLTRFARIFYGDDTLVVQYDRSTVDALQEDQDKLFARWGKLYKDGVCTRAEAKRGVGLPFDENEDDVYSTDAMDPQTVDEAAKALVKAAAEERARRARQEMLEADAEDGDRD